MQSLKINDDFFNFIERNKDADVSSLLLKYHNSPLHFDLQLALIQIECRKKHKNKLKHFFSSPKTIIPDKSVAEQSSNEIISSYHSSLISKNDRILDMTAGLGIDSIAFSEKCNEIDAFELSQNRACALKHNARFLGKNNIKVFNRDSVEYLTKVANLTYDAIFVDPARRDSSNNRIFKLSDSLPNIIENQSLIKSKCKRFFIKASPLLDISQTLKDISDIVSIRVICLKGECKEVLIEVLGIATDLEKNNQNKNETTQIIGIDIDNDGEIISNFSMFLSSDSKELLPKKQKPYNIAEISDLKSGSFIYEPNAAIMKIQPWEVISERYPTLKKFSSSSHLFVSDDYFPDFPGRITRFEKLLNKKELKSLKGFAASVVSRNHPQSPENIRKSYALKESDQNFIYATKIGTRPLLFLSIKNSL